MDNLTFISEVISSLAWPVAVVVSVWVLREKLGGAIGKITKVKHKDSEISFSQALAEAKEINDKKSSETEKVDQNTLISYGPRGAILEAWLSVEQSVKHYAKRHNQPLRENSSPMRMLQELNMVGTDHGANLGKGIMQMLLKLRELRNTAVHLAENEISVEDAKEYVKLANRVIERIDEA